MKLNRKVVIYVPGKMGDRPMPEDQKRWKRECLTRFANLFGGATAQDAEGAWMGEDGLVIEPVVLVYAYTDAVTLADTAEQVRALAREMAEDMAQECVSVELEDGLEFAKAA